MTDFGGLSVKELPQAVKDALLDPGVLRSLASGANPFVGLSEAGAMNLKVAMFDYVNPGEWISTGPVGFTPILVLAYYGAHFCHSYGAARSVADQSCSFQGMAFDTSFHRSWFAGDRIGKAYRIGWVDCDLFVTGFAPASIDFHNVITGMAPPPTPQILRIFVLG